MPVMEATSRFAIHDAAREGRTAVVESILNCFTMQENPNLALQRDMDERLPIHWATSYGHRDIVVLLAQRKDFDPDVQDGSGWTPLMIAVSLKEGEDLVDLFLSKGADINQTNFSGQSALHFTASKNNLNIARRLLSNKPQASTRVKDNRGQYPIHRAAAVGSTPMVELLLGNKSPLDATDGAGYTPLHHAVAEGHGDTAVALLKAGAATDKRDIDGILAMDLAPDAQVSYVKKLSKQEQRKKADLFMKVRKFILQSAEREGIEI